MHNGTNLSLALGNLDQELPNQKLKNKSDFEFMS